MVGKELYPRNIDNTLNNYFFKAPITAPFAVSYFEEILLVKLPICLTQQWGVLGR